MIIFSSSQAQQWEWARKANHTSSSESPSFIKTDSFGNLYLFGDSNGGNQYGATVLSPGPFIVKFDSLGTVIWANNITYSGISIDLFDVDKSGNILLSGYFYGTASISGFNFTSQGQEDIFLVKLNSSGSPLWGKSFGGSGGDIPGSIAIDQDLNIYLDGGFGSYGDSTITFDSFALTGNGHFFLTKFNSAGKAVWASTGDPSFTGGNTIAIDKFSNIYLTAYSSQFYGTVIAKFNSAGILLSHYLKWGDYDYVPALVVSDLGNIYLLHNGGGHYGFVPILVKYDSLMNEQWSKSIGTYYGCYQFGAGVFIDKSENIYVGGRLGSYCNSDSVYFQGKLAYVGNDAVPAIAKFNTSGNLLWVQSGVAADYDGIAQMCQSITGNFYVAGQFNNTTTGDGDTLALGSNTLLNDGNWAQIFVAKLNLLNSPVSVNEIASDNLFELFPNPSSGMFNVQFRNSQSATMISVYNIFGKCLWSKDCRGENVQQIDLNNEAKGLYFMEIVSDGGRAVKKIVLQ